MFACFGAGLSLAAVLLHQRADVAQLCSERWSLEALVTIYIKMQAQHFSAALSISEHSLLCFQLANVLHCAELDSATPPPPPSQQPQYAADVLAKEPWKGLRIDSDLDRAVDSVSANIRSIRTSIERRHTFK